MSSPDLERLTREVNQTIKDRGLKRIPRDLFADLKAQGLKRCPTCQTVKPRSGFAARAASSDGLCTNCRDCHSGYHQENRDREIQRMADYRAANRERLREQTKNYRRDNPLVGRIADGRRRAETWGAVVEDFNATDLLAHWETVGIDKDRSAYSGVDLTPENFSLDHLVPLSQPGGPGHVVTNLVPCTKHENKSKHDRHFIDLLARVHADSLPVVIL